MGDEQPTSQEDFIPRIGTFLILLGIFSLIFFVTSDLARKPEFDWLFVGMIFLAIGFLFRRRAPSPPPAGRFAGIRTLRENSKKRKQEKADKKKAKKK